MDNNFTFENFPFVCEIWKEAYNRGFDDGTNKSNYSRVKYAWKDAYAKGFVEGTAVGLKCNLETIAKKFTSKGGNTNG